MPIDCDDAAEREAPLERTARRENDHLDPSRAAPALQRRGQMHRILCAVCISLVAVPSMALAQGRALGHTVRWDLIRIQQGTALAGGADIAFHAATGDTFTLTGSGDVKPAKREAAGGGTSVHHFAATNVDSAAIWLVTGFIDWQPGGGQLPIVDGIGDASEATGGVLKLAIRILLPSGAVVDAALTVNCHLPGGTFVDDGIDLSITGTPFVNMVPHGGAALFHVQK
jgi:hypothetical protein